MKMQATSHDLVIRGDIVLSDRILHDGWIAITGDTVVAVGTGEAPPARDCHDATGDYVIPGAVDGQTHATSYGGLPGIESTTRSACAGGITTLVDMPYDNPAPLNNLEKFNAKKEAIEQVSYCDIALYGTVLPGQGTADMRPLAEAGVVAFKISSFQSDPVRFPRLPASDMLEILREAKAINLPVGLHNEDQEIVEATIASLKARGLTTPEWHDPSRPIAAEIAATAAFLALGADTGAHVHIVHASCKAVLDLVAHYRDMGAQATAEVCCHYLHFEPAQDMQRLGARIKVSPPIRTHMRETMWNEFRKDRIAFISSDHSSWPLSRKLTDSIFDAGAGIPGLETLVPSFYTDLQGQVETPVRALVEYLCERPARFFGIWPRKGQIAPGADADIVILKKGPVRFDEAKTHDDLNWSPYHGETFAVSIAATYVRGTRVWDGDNITAKPGTGTYIPKML
ncbi:dihydroorotase family protein [Komagataeibacter xylinus]|nr:amidohydrolase family protein [Komagataeibacter xylinus]